MPPMTKDELNKAYREKYNKRFKSVKISKSTWELLNELRGSMSLNEFIRDMANDIKTGR